MKAFAKSFYKSKSWRACRAAYIEVRRQIDGGMCEQCRQAPGEELHHTEFLTPQNIHNPEVSLNQAKLQWLCKDCHFKAHREAIMKGFEKRKKKRILSNGIYFDENGNPKPQRVVIVWGPPASGKLTYIREHMDDTDMVIDLDLIRQAITMGSRDTQSNNLLAVALTVREQLYKLVEKREKIVDCRTVWIAATLPRREERETLMNRLRAEQVFIHTSYEDCIDHAMKDENRKDKMFQRYIIEKWFEDYEE